MGTSQEPLELSAPIAWRLAQTLCRRDAQTQDSCAWIHGLWQYLRILDLASTPSQHADFYVSAFDAVPAGVDAPRVLVSGAADYAMLACVLSAFRTRRIEPVVTVVDRCETPLMLNRWYAERLSCRIETVRADMTDYSDARGFDAICTHSFFSELSQGERVGVLDRWRHLLRPEGRVITVNRIRPKAAADPAVFLADQARAFGATVLRRAQGLRERLQVDPHELSRCAEIYAARRKAYPLRSREEIVQLFEGAGLRIERLSLVSAKNATQAVSGPTTPAGADYAHIIATAP